MYLDTAASTIVSKEVKNKIKEVIEIYGNPSSIHKEGKTAKDIIINAKKIISQKFNCEENELYFTSGATMSNNIIIQGFIRKYKDAVVIYSAIEHNDIIMMAKFYGKKIFKKIPVDSRGFVDLIELEKLLKKYEHRNVLVTIQAANSEIGTIQNISKISTLIHKYKKTYFHSDFTQFVPYFKVDLKNMNIDAMSMSGQKIHCIKGTGLAYVSNALSISPIIFGEQGLIGGTENVLGISCLAEAINNIDYDINPIIIKRNYLIFMLNKPLIGSYIDRLPNHVSVLFKDLYSEELVELFNQFDISVSAGSACSSGNPAPSHVLREIGMPDNDINSVIRFSINRSITYEDINNIVDKIRVIEKILK